MRLQVTDDDGAPAVATPPGGGGGRRRRRPGNLVANPSFETGTVGWSGYQGTLAREAQAGAPNGAYVARVTRSSGTYFTIDGGPTSARPSAGTTYTATAWVKAASASSVGKPIQIKLRERTASGTVGRRRRLGQRAAHQRLAAADRHAHDRRRQPARRAPQPRLGRDRQRLLRRRVRDRPGLSRAACPCPGGWEECPPTWTAAGDIGRAWIAGATGRSSRSSLPASSVERALDVVPLEAGYSQHSGGERAAWNDAEPERTATLTLVARAAARRSYAKGWLQSDLVAGVVLPPS